MIFTLLLITFTSIAQAGPLPVRFASAAPNLSGGIGEDFARVRVHATEEQFSAGDYFLSFSIVWQELRGYRLPAFDVEQKCEFRRLRDGRVGDFKPKGAQASVRIGYGQDYAGLFTLGNPQADYNDNPVVQRVDHGAGMPIVLNSYTKGFLARLCSAGPGTRSVRVYWVANGLCRWKPENWHKPGNFPFEYKPAYEAKIVRDVVLNCVR